VTSAFVLAPPGAGAGTGGPALPAPAVPLGYSPQQIRAAYSLPPQSALPASWSGAGQTIAIVVAYQNAALASDLQQFDAKFQIPTPPQFQVFNQDGALGPLPGSEPAASGTAWAEEAALDVEWAHALAPGAGIDVVEASSASTHDLFAAVTTAAGLTGVSVVSMSWDLPEFSGETALDHVFTTPAGHQGVTFVAAAGDNGSAATYPASSPNVLAVGGTTLNVNPATAANPSGSYGGETPWSGSGGGVSGYETEPSYQSGSGIAGGGRDTPDVAFDANPATGVAVDDDGSWLVMGGTSVGTPGWAALVAIANAMRVSAGATTLDGASQTLPAIYGLSASDFHEVGVGRGSPVANLLVPALAASGSSGDSPVPAAGAASNVASPLTEARAAGPVLVDYLLEHGLLSVFAGPAADPGSAPAPTTTSRAGQARPSLTLTTGTPHPTFRVPWAPPQTGKATRRMDEQWTSS